MTRKRAHVNFLYRLHHRCHTEQILFRAHGQSLLAGSWPSKKKPLRDRLQQRGRLYRKVCEGREKQSPNLRGGCGVRRRSSFPLFLTKSHLRGDGEVSWSSWPGDVDRWLRSRVHFRARVLLLPGECASIWRNAVVMAARREPFPVTGYSDSQPSSEPPGPPAGL